MSEAVLDTNIFVDHMRGLEIARKIMEKVRNGSLMGYVSVLTKAELLAGKDAENVAKKNAIENMLAMFSKVDVTEAIAEKAGAIRRKYGTSLPDAIIAATAENIGCKLLSQDYNDFKNIKEITVEKPY